MTLKSQSSCLYLLSAGITGTTQHLGHLVQRLQPSLVCAGERSTLTGRAGSSWSREKEPFSPNLQGWLRMQRPEEGQESLGHSHCHMSLALLGSGPEVSKTSGSLGRSQVHTQPSWLFFSFFLKLTQTQTDCGGSWKAESCSGLEQHRVSGFRYGAWCRQPGALGRVGSTLWP